jgi:WD40 repeat protein/serine/threonine protein kinase
VTEPSSARDPVEALAESFLDRYRRGERPCLAEYIDRHPELADQIRALFPALVEVEGLAAPDGDATGPHDRAEPAAGPAPEQLGDYRIVREIGRGGMGVVYEATRGVLGCNFALKVLGPQYRDDPAYRRRFLAEARAAARLLHTHIVPVFDWGEQAGVLYYVMQLIPGQGLDKVLADVRRLRAAPAAEVVGSAAVADAPAPTVARSLLDGGFAQGGDPAATLPLAADDSPAVAPPAPPARAADTSSHTLAGRPASQYHRAVARVGVQVAAALAHAHRHGVLHRDVKPSNLLLDAMGNAWVTDFGLAKLQDAADASRSRDVAGTLRYMAPERFDGRSDARSDVYALGATLYEMLTLRPAFAGDDQLRLIDRILHEPPTPPQQLDRQVPRDLETIVLKALAKSPADRYPTADAMAEDLRRFSEGRPTLARPVGPLGRAWRWSRRNPVVAGLLAALFTVVLSVAVGATLSALRFRDLFRAFQSQFYFSNVALAHRECRDESLGRAERLLDECPAELRDWEWRYLKRWSHTSLLTLRKQPGNRVLGVAYSPDGKKLASSNFDGTVTIWDAIDGRLLLDLRGHAPTNTNKTEFSPDGTVLASCGSDGFVRIWDVATGRLLRELPGHSTKDVFSLAFSPDGKRLASSCTRVMKLWDTKTWQEVASAPWDGFVAFSPTSRLIAVSGWVKFVIMDVAALEKSKGQVKPIVSLDGFLSRLAFSPDGRSIVVCGKEADEAAVLDTESGRSRFVLPGPSRGIKDVAYSPDGRYIATASYDRMVRVWDAKTGRLLRSFSGHINGVQSVAFSPDGQRIASGSIDGTVRVWDMKELREPARQEARTLASPTGGALGVGYRQDGGAFATIGGAPFVGDRAGDIEPASVDSVTFWDARTFQVIRIVRNPTGGVCHDLAIDPAFARIAWAKGDGTVEIRDAITDRVDRTLSGHQDLVQCVAYSRDGRLLASASRDGTVRICDPATGRQIREMQMWDGPPRRKAGIRPSDGTDVSGLVFSPDGRRLAVAFQTPTAVKVWDTATGQTLTSLSLEPERVMNIAFDGDGRRLACSIASDVVLFDPSSGRELRRLRGHTSFVWGVAFSADGRRVISTGADGTVKIWEAETGREILSLLHGRDEITSMSLSPDGHKIVSAGTSGTIKVWDATPLP